MEYAMAVGAVTIPGSSPALTVTTGTGDILNLAAQISALLTTTQQTNNNLSVTFDSVGGSLPLAPTVSSPTVTDLVLSVPGSVNAIIPSGFKYVQDVGSSPDTLSGTNVAMVTGTVGGVYFAHGNSTVAVESGNSTVSATDNYLISLAPGNDVVFASGSGTVATHVGSSTIVATIGNNVILSNGTGDAIFATNGSATVNVSGDATSIAGGSAFLQVSLAGANDVVGVGNGNTSIITAGSQAIVYGGSVNGQGLNIVNSGAGTTISTAASNANVISSGSNAALREGSGLTLLAISGSNNTVFGSTGASTISAVGTNGVLVFGGSGTLNFIGGAGASQILGAPGGHQQATVGTGGLTLSANGADSATITSGAGTAVVYGSDQSYAYFKGNQTGVTFLAGAGNETLDAAGSSTNNYLIANTLGGSADIIGGTGADVMFAGNGSATMTGGGGRDSFAFFAQNTSIPGGARHDYITDFTAADSLYILGYDSTKTASDLQNGATVSSFGVTLKLSDNTLITFSNLTSASSLDGHILYT
jgi:Ca2+-binding RTX toxin-like protein